MPLSVSPLCKALALYNLIDEMDGLDGGVPLRELERQWAATGLRLDDLHEVLADAVPRGEFEVVRNSGTMLVRVVDFEQRKLNPSTLVEIEELQNAYSTLERLQLRLPEGRGYGRRTYDSLQ